MINLFRKKEKIKEPIFVTVEEIHAEFDSAEERILAEAREIIEATTPSEKKSKKANMLENLGFSSSEIVVENIEAKEIIGLSSGIANYINELKVKYPIEKFITVKELDRICNKYNLIHAPVSNYERDVPEKNVLEMSNRKELDRRDISGELYHYNMKYFGYVPKEVRSWFENNNTYSFVSNDSELRDICPIKYKGEHLYESDTLSRELITRKGLFIAAPQTHFNLEGLSKKTKNGFFETHVTLIDDDPIVFEYCQNDIVRIVTKWGTEDDQSYLDDALTNESLN